MRNKKRFAALALATVLAVSQVTAVAPTSAVVAEETEEAEYEFSENSETDDSSDSSDTEATSDVEEESLEENEGEDSSQSEETEDESDAETEESEDDSETDDEEDLNVGITLAGVSENGISVASEDGDEETEGEENTEEDEESESWWIDVDWQNNTNCLLVEETVSEIVYLQHYYYYEEDEDGWWTTETIPVDEYTCTLGYDTGSLDVSTDTTEDGYGLILNVEGIEEGDVTLTIRLYEESGEMIVKDYLYFYVSDSGYYYLTAEDSDGIVVPLGESYDLTDAGFTLYYVSNDEDGEAVAVPVDELEYTLSVDWWEDYVFTSLEGMILTNRIHTDGTYAWVVAYDNEGEYLADTSIGFDNLDYNIELSLTDENLNEYGVYIVYGYEQTVELTQSEDDAYELPEGYKVVWDIEDESGLLSTVDSDDTSLTLEVTDEDTDYDGWWANVHAAVYYGDNEICSADRDFEIVIPYAEYYTWEDTTLALGEGSWYEANVGCYVRSYEYPYGENTSVEVTDLSVVSQYEYTEDGEQLTDDVISLEGDAESGWNIGTNTYGYANMRATYTDVDGEEQTFAFTIYVEGEYYNLNYAYLEETDGRVQVDSTITIDTSLEHVYSNDDGGAEYETIEDYLSEGFSLNYSDYDEEIISVEITNDGDGGPDRMLAVTGLAEGGTDLYLYVTNEDDDVVADVWLWIEVTEDYYVLSYESKTLPLGATVDMGDLESNEYVVYTLTHYYTNDEGESVSDTIELTNDNSYIEMEGYDDGCLELVDEDGTQLTRTNTWETWADVHVMLYNDDSEEYEEVASCGVVFSELTYDISLTNDSLDGNWVTYAGIDMTVSYELSDDSDSLPDDAEYIWAVQYWDDDEQDMLDVYEDLATWTENEDGTITISTYSDERDIRVSLQVIYGDNEIIWAEEWISTRSEGSYINIWVEDGSLLYGESTYVYGTYGDDSNELTFSDVEVVSFDSWDDYDSGIGSENTCATVSQDKEGNWVITANTDGYYGVVQVIVTYYDLYEEEVGAAEAGTIWVGGDEIVFEYPEGQDFEINRPEEDNTIEIPVEVYHVHAEQNDDGEWETQTEGVDICGLVYYNEYDNSVIEVSYSYEGNSLVFTVTGLEEGWTNFSFSIVDENSDEQGYEWINISVNGKLDANMDAEEYTVEKEYGDEEFNLMEEIELTTDSDAEIQYTILQGEDVVEIDENGNITIIGVGTAVIKVYVEETNTYSYAKVNITIEVDKADAAITGTDSYEVTYGTTEEFYLEDIKATGDGKLSYEVTSGTAVVSVDETGLVKVLSAGTAEITVSASETDLYKAATLTVTVTVNEAETETESETESETAATESETTATESETTATESESETETLYIIEAATDDEYMIGKDTSAVVKCNGELSEFISVAVDGVTVDASNYTLTEGSTIITFTQEYMDTLSVGVHTVTLTYTGDRTVDALLTVRELAGSSEDQTGSETTPTESETETETTVTESETETETTATESETETETTATESETETETTATESETETQTEAQTGTGASGSETDPTGTETDENGSETDESGMETEAETTETESETTVTVSETTASETTSTETTATESETDATVATGDNSPIEIYVAVMLLAMSILMAGTLYRRMNRNAR